MIRLRRTLERGRKHPILGPILLIVLILVLVMVFLHTAHEGHDAGTEIVGFCLAILAIVGPILLARASKHPVAVVIAIRGDRGPPRVGQIAVAVSQRAGPTFGIPLRR